MTHLYVVHDAQGITPEMLFDMTRKQFRECPLSFGLKVSLLNEYTKKKRVKS